MKDGSHRSRSPTAQLRQTIREFIKAGEDCADFVSDGILTFLISYERLDRDLPYVPSMWLLNNILPITNPTILDRECWQTCLNCVVSWKPGHLSLPEILRHCDTSMARSGLLKWISNPSGFRSLKEGMVRNFQLLVQMSGGLCFVHEDDLDEETSPILMAVCFSKSFTIFRAVLEEIGIDIREVIRNQIEVYPNGWTEERLLSLYLDRILADWKRPSYCELDRCKLCKHHLQDPDCNEIKWKRRVERIRVGVDIDAPLSEDEERDQKEVDDAIEDFKNGICLSCRWKKQETRKWIPFG